MKTQNINYFDFVDLTDCQDIIFVCGVDAVNAILIETS